MPMMHCKVFRSDRKAETYLYLADDILFADLPEDLREHFGEPAFVMRLKLAKERKLARVDVVRVIESLSEQGFYLQLPPKLPVEEEIARRFS